MFRKYSSAFTLVELLVVIAIIGILASIVMANLGSARDRSQVAATFAQLKEIETALKLYALDEETFKAWPEKTVTIARLIDQSDSFTEEFVGFDAYLSVAPTPPIAEGVYKYSFSGAEYSAGSESHNTGVNIQIDVTGSNYAAVTKLYEDLDEVVDNGDGPALGVVRSGGDSNPMYFLIATGMYDL